MMLIVFSRLAQDSPSEATIQRDINRTFPAHDYFRESGGVGQDALFKISKAYAVYDEEIGYCQGFSFLAAALVLHVRRQADVDVHDCTFTCTCSNCSREALFVCINLINVARFDVSSVDVILFK